MTSVGSLSPGTQRARRRRAFARAAGGPATYRRAQAMAHDVGRAPDKVLAFVAACRCSTGEPPVRRGVRLPYAPDVTAPAVGLPRCGMALLPQPAPPSPAAYAAPCTPMSRPGAGERPAVWMQLVPMPQQDPAPTTYTCPDHRTLQRRAGTCPQCGMKLLPQPPRTGGATATPAPGTRMSLHPSRGGAPVRDAIGWPRATACLRRSAPPRPSPIDLHDPLGNPRRSDGAQPVRPLRREGKRLHRRWPTRPTLEKLDERPPRSTRASSARRHRRGIDVVLRKGDATQRVLQEATSGFRISLVKRPSTAKGLRLDRWRPTRRCLRSSSWLTRSSTRRWVARLRIHSRRATRRAVKYRIDGALLREGEPILVEYHQTLISRIKVMSEMDIAERRACPKTAAPRPLQGPQSGLPRLRHADRHGEAPSSVSATRSRITSRSRTHLDVRSASRGRLAQLPRATSQSLRHGARHRPDRIGQDDDSVRGPQRDQERRRQDITIEDPVEYQLHVITQIPSTRRRG